MSGSLLHRCALRPHPSSMDDPKVAAVEVEVLSAPLGSRLAVRFVGSPGHLALPADTLDPELLWEHTCGELFLARADGSYIEWNFSPTGQATCFEFAGYRRRSASHYDVPIRVECARTSDGAVLTAEGPLIAEPFETASITAIAETPAGLCSYWALAHPKAEPDFHDARGFVLPGSLF